MAPDPRSPENFLEACMLDTVNLTTVAHLVTVIIIYLLVKTLGISRTQVIWNARKSALGAGLQTTVRTYWVNAGLDALE